MESSDQPSTSVGPPFPLKKVRTSMDWKWEPALVELAGGGERGAGDLFGVEAVGALEGAVLAARQRPRQCLRLEVVAEPRLVFRLRRRLLHAQPNRSRRKKRSEEELLRWSCEKVAFLGRSGSVTHASSQETPSSSFSGGVVARHGCNSRIVTSSWRDYRISVTGLRPSRRVSHGIPSKKKNRGGLDRSKSKTRLVTRCQRNFNYFYLNFSYIIYRLFILSSSHCYLGLTN